MFSSGWSRKMCQPEIIIIIMELEEGMTDARMSNVSRLTWYASCDTLNLPISTRNVVKSISFVLYPPLIHIPSISSANIAHRHPPRDSHSSNRWQSKVLILLVMPISNSFFRKYRYLPSIARRLNQSANSLAWFNLRFRIIIIESIYLEIQNSKLHHPLPCIIFNRIQGIEGFSIFNNPWRSA